MESGRRGNNGRRGINGVGKRGMTEEEELTESERRANHGVRCCHNATSSLPNRQSAHFMVVSMSSFVATPSEYTMIASLMYGIRRRLAMNAGASFEVTTVLPHRSAKAVAVSTTSWDVCNAGISSTSLSTGEDGLERREKWVSGAIRPSHDIV